MSKQVITKIQPSASLLLLAKDKRLMNNESFNYKALLFKRPTKSSFMPAASVFPGGACEPTDAAIAWLDYFKYFGINKAHLDKFIAVDGLRPSMFLTKTTEQMLASAISLRITAIRETFEEVGILLCRKREENFNGSTIGTYGHVIDNFDCKYWQNLIHQNADQFLNFCKELDVVPDIWSMHEWSMWRTPSFYQKRFDAAFYLTAIKDIPTVSIDPKEVDNYDWLTPLECLKANISKKILLPPPQFYELSRLLSVKNLDELLSFAAKRAQHGIAPKQNVVFKCSDGEVAVLPGDDMYPRNPDASAEKFNAGMSIEEFRKKAKNLHRVEHSKRIGSIIQLNIDFTDGQMKPLNLSSLHL